MRKIQGRHGPLLGGFLFMIMSREKRSGWGTKFMRTWCHLIKAYGTEPIWAAQGVGPEGEAFLRELDRRGEIRITSVDGSMFFARCEWALEDPRQQRLFSPTRAFS